MPEENLNQTDGAKLDQLMTHLQGIEKLRKNQSRIRTLSLLVIVACVGVMGWSIYASYKKFDKDRFVQNMKKELQEKYSDDLGELAQAGQKKLWPQFKQELEKSLGGRFEKLKEKYTKLASEKTSQLDEKVQKNLVVLLNEFEDELHNQLPTQDLHDAMEKLAKKQGEVVTDLSIKMQKEFEKNTPKLEEVKQSLQELTQSPQAQQLTLNDAKDLFLESIIDLFKYEILPSRGAELADASSKITEVR